MIEKRTIFEMHRLSAEGFSSRGIARRLGVSRKTVQKYLENPDPVAGQRKKRPSKLDRYHELIEAFLEQDPQVQGTVVLQRLKDQGFEGKISILRDYLRRKRKRIKKPEAFMRFESAAGYQMQIDWGHFGSLQYGETNRKLYALAVIESHSRMLYVAFTHSQKQAALHQGLVNAFGFFGGTPKELVVDNMVSAVTERQGSLIRFNEAFLDFLRPFSIVPRACTVGAAHEKGKIENSIRYLRHNFWPLRSFADLDDVQRQVVAWLNEVANVRIHQTTGQRPVDRFKPECLKPLPQFLPDCRETTEVLVYKDFAVKFDGNSYTAPPWTIGKRLTLKADQHQIILYRHERIVARHKRSWQRHKRIELAQHQEEVKKLNKKLWQDRDIAAFASLGQAARHYLQGLTEVGQPMKKNVVTLLKLKDHYGSASVLQAIEKALAYRAFGAEYIEHILYQEKRPHREHQPVKLKQETLNHLRLPEPNLADYDSVILQRRKDDDA
jgi:transposase